MNNWKKCKLGDIGKVITGKTPSAKNPEDWGNDMCFITPTDYKDYRKIASSSIRKLSNIGIERLKNKILPPKSIMVTCIGSDMGKVAVNKNPSITNQQINSIIPYEKVADADFVYYLLVSMYDTLRTYGLDGTAVPILNKSDFETIEILLPPLEEQRQIAAILSSIDDKIELLHEQNKTLEELAQTLFRHYFIENPNPSWQNVKIKKLVNITSGKSLKRLDMQDDGENPILGANGIIGFTNKYLYNEPLLYTGRVGTLGKVFMINSAKKVWLSDNTLIINPSSNFYFMYFILKTSSLENLDVGSTQPLIRQSDLGEIEISLADDLLLEQFDIAAKKIFDKIDKNLEQIQTLENMRDILIPKLLNGEIKINN